MQFYFSCQLLQYFSNKQVQEFEKRTYLPKFAELEPEWEIESVLTEVRKGEGKKRADGAVISVYVKYVTVKTRDVLIVNLLRKRS